MKILSDIRDEDLRRALDEAARAIDAEIVDFDTNNIIESTGRPGTRGDVILVEVSRNADLEAIHARVRGTGTAIVAACHDPSACENALLTRADEWLYLPAEPDEIALRLTSARNRALGIDTAKREEEIVNLVRYRELLFDKLTGFPTLPVVIQHARELLASQGELTILYIHFVWYSRLEELYGWQKLDDVLETTADAVREFYSRKHPSTENVYLVSHAADDDFILFTHLPTSPDVAERELRALASQLEAVLREAIERAHGEDIAALGNVYVGTSTIFRNPKIRTERLIYRGIREAASAARSAMEWERTQKIADLQDTIREGAVYMEYHPIIVTDSEAIYGYEALARGAKRELRSPDVLFEVAAEANLLWELGRLLRTRAIEGISKAIKEDQYLFLNIDPHDFNDPQFRTMNPAELGIDDPAHIVLEITERTAIKDYPRFQNYLAELRERGFRFAVDDAGSGYAGLGSIANLAPDYIKLDISLISNIDTNFLKQNLVETMVSFAENHGAKVIAEGVERREEFETIREIGVHLTQGFLFHRPKSPEALIAETNAQ